MSLSFDTLAYEERGGVAWVTLNRPEVMNAFDATMRRELHELWRTLRSRDEVRAVVLTGAGDKAFCSGIDRSEIAAGPGGDGSVSATAPSAGPTPAARTEPVDGTDGGATPAQSDATPHATLADTRVGSKGSPFQFDDPGGIIGPKSCDLWKPVVAAVNGIACGGAFYLLGECDVIIAAEHATFFDPHVTYGMVAVFEPIQMLSKMPFGEIVRLSLLGAHERMSARRAYEIGLVSEVVPLAELADRARWVAETIASAPPLAIQGTLRALWSGLELGRTQALAHGYALVGLGTDAANLTEGQRRFASGERVEWRLR